METESTHERSRLLKPSGCEDERARGKTTRARVPISPICGVPADPQNKWPIVAYVDERDKFPEDWQYALVARQLGILDRQPKE